jgi:hypothetical protein
VFTFSGGTTVRVNVPAGVPTVPAPRVSAEVSGHE